MGDLHATPRRYRVVYMDGTSEVVVAENYELRSRDYVFTIRGEEVRQIDRWRVLVVEHEP